MKGMRTVGLKVLKNKLSEYVRLAANGEVILITDRDHVVAEIIAPQAGRSASASDARLAELVRNGVLTPPTLPPDAPLPPMKPITTFNKLMQQLREDRGDR
jgi:antitoxin (DNA-binding transcriptional repressor) of toxin-antitoxin stability system